MYRCDVTKIVAVMILIQYRLHTWIAAAAVSCHHTCRVGVFRRRYPFKCV